jgi:siroheme synthase (precorrin-2 oxidase/ferrochelatase)
VSTSGGSPGYAADLRRRLEPHVDEAESQALELIKQGRARLRELITDQDSRFAAVNELVALGLAEVIRRDGLAAAEAKIEQAMARWEKP